MFFTFPTKYAYWAELVLISVVTPNASFLGHLCGILVGLAYVRGFFAAIPLIGTPPRLQPGAWFANAILLSIYLEGSLVLNASHVAVGSFQPSVVKFIYVAHFKPLPTAPKE